MTERMYDLPPQARPRERLWALGPRALNPIELVALVLGTGKSGCSAMSLAASLVAGFGGLRGLAAATPEELAAREGMGPAKAASLLAALQLGLHMSAPLELTAPCALDDLAEIARRELGGRRREHVLVMVLDPGQRLRRVIEVSSGSVDTSLFPIREILNAVLRNDGKVFAVAHNHPGGDAVPSSSDIAVTEELAMAAYLLDLEFLDHIVVGATEWGAVSAYTEADLAG